jgi:fructokinase
MTATSKSPSVIALGEVLWDVLPTEKLLGGAPANFCHRLRQLGVNARMVSRIGKDALGEELARGLKALKFDQSLIQLDEQHPTGTVDVSLATDGNPTFTINTDVAYDFVEATPELLKAAEAASLICFGTLVQRSPRSRDTIYRVLEAAPNATKFLDINLRKNCYSAETVSESLRRADIVKLNTSEVTIISELLSLGVTTPRELALKLMQDFGVNTVLVTLGEKGVYALDALGHECTVPGISIQVVDTIGSGDSFAAGFVSTYLAGAPLEECCHFGNLTGALNATKKGGMPDISPSELQLFLGKHQKAA